MQPALARGETARGETALTVTVMAVQRVFAPSCVCLASSPQPAPEWMDTPESAARMIGARISAAIFAVATLDAPTAIFAVVAARVADRRWWVVVAGAAGASAARARRRHLGEPAVLGT